MKLIKQTTLVFREGGSDKIYEVDLCEVGADSFVVNFRYGRRGANLKEGAKTVAPVARSAADKTFQDLVDSKTKKGYRPINTAGAPTNPPQPKTTRAINEGARTRIILDRLQNPTRGEQKKGWPLERVIWRAGELRLREAAPLLVNLIGSGGALRDYCIAWSLGWCGDASHVSALGRLYADSSASDSVRRISAEALLKISDEQTKTNFRAGAMERLPIDLREAAGKGPSAAFAARLRAYLDGAGENHERYSALELIYLIDNQNVRPALLVLLREAPLRPNYFRQMRHVFKAAEYRRDAEVYGLLAYRFEKERAMFRNSWFPLNGDRQYSYLTVGGAYVSNAHQEIKKKDAPIAFGHRTKTYLRRRSWRTLDRQGQLGDAEYVKMAVGVLLPFTDADAQPVRESSTYLWQSGRTNAVGWDAYAPYWTFNHILYANSPRYYHLAGAAAWRCRPGYQPGAAEPAAREEAYPELWERTPVGLLHLISESGCRPVQHFAVKALRACKEFCAELDRESILMILGRPYEATAQLGFELARERYRPGDPDLELVLAVANSASPEARAEAHGWIDQSREQFVRDGDFVVALVTSPQPDTREFARRLLRSSVLPDATARTLIVRLIAHLTGFGDGQEAEAADVAETIFKSFGNQLRQIGLDVVRDLLAHPLREVQELGANILLIHDVRPGELPEEIIIALINSPFESLRGIGVRLLGELPAESLKRRENLLLALATHSLGDVRHAVRPVIQNLTAGDGEREFAERLARRLIDSLLAPDATVDEDAQRGVANMLWETFGADVLISVVDKDTALKLTRAKSTAAHELSGRVIEAKTRAGAGWAESFTTDEIADLVDSETLAVRTAAQTLFDAVVDRYRQATNPADHLGEMARAVRLLDAKWDDARKHFFDAFRTNFGAADFTPGLLVSICDSVREDVQSFGRALITEYFSEAEGQEYMLKLSEHPSADLQLFVTNYLERYCADDPARLRELSAYFTSVLSRVNKARVAKERVVAFLTAEAAKSVEAARAVAAIFARQSATVAVGQKAAMIEAMLIIHRAHPDVPVPINVNRAEVRRAV